MTTLELWIQYLTQSDAAKALGWTLLHSLWEGAAIALLLAMVFAIARSSRVRYSAACLAMLALLVGFGATLYRLAPREVYRPAAIVTHPQPVSPTVDARPPSRKSTWRASDLLPWLAPFWLVGVLLFQLRCLIAWTAAGRLRTVGVCEPPHRWLENLDELRARLRLSRPVTLLESCFAEVPVVIGHLRPVILMPVGLLAGLPPGQVEAILLHELAHIRRADYLVNLMQTLVEGLLFYHPAVWWISSAIRTERENCCDDLVVLTSGDAHEYATALAALAENRWTMRQAALAATGGNLVKRIRRLLQQPEGPRTTIAPVLSVLVVAGAIALGAWQSPAPLPMAPIVHAWAQPLLMAPARPAQTAPQAAPATNYDKWLHEEAAYIITDQEHADFKKLETDADRARFIRDFWERRNPTPGSARNEFREEHYRRIAYANDRFAGRIPGWKTDRGRIYIEYGPPDEIDSHPAGGTYIRPQEEGGGQTVTYPFEQWRYKLIQGMGANIILEFVDKAKTGEYRLVMDPAEKEAARQAELQADVQRERLQSQAQQLADLADLRMHVIEKQLESMPQQDFQAQQEAILRAQSNAVLLQERLRVLEKQLKSRNVDLLQSQAQIEKLNETLSAFDRQAMEPIYKQLALLQEHFEEALPAEAETRKMLLKTLIKSRDGLQEVFLSGAAVVILANRSMVVTVPLEFPAKQYSISVTALAPDGTKLWSTTKETSEHGSLTIEGVPLDPGSYTLKALVKDTAGSTEKTYVVNFSVK